jgi:hypothetical protein
MKQLRSEGWFAVAVLAFFLFGLYMISGNIDRCKNAGGVWLARENMCVKGLTRIEP